MFRLRKLTLSQTIIVFSPIWITLLILIRFQLLTSRDAMEPPDAEFELWGDKEFELIKENQRRAANGIPPLSRLSDWKTPPAPSHPEW